MILEQNKKCEFQFCSYFWDRVSDQARDLIIKMIAEDPNQRISAKEALNHPWITMNFNDVGE